MKHASFRRYLICRLGQNSCLNPDYGEARRLPINKGGDTVQRIGQAMTVYIQFQGRMSSPLIKIFSRDVITSPVYCPDLINP